MMNRATPKGYLSWGNLIHQMNVPRNCSECGQPFITTTRSEKTCGARCRRARKTRMARLRERRNAVQQRRAA